IASLFGIRHVVLAVNKMDLVDYGQSVFEDIAGNFRNLAERLGIADVTCIPLSALRGDNMASRSPAMPWYSGPVLLDHLASVEVRRKGSAGGFRLPVQRVCRPDQDFRGLAGTVCAGEVKAGDDIVVLPSGRRSKIARIVTFDGDLASASAGQAVTITLADEIDASRGDVVAAAQRPPEVADQFAAHLLWLADEAMLPSRSYWMKLGTKTVAAQITEIKHRVDVDTQEHLAAKHLSMNEVAFCNLYLDQAIAFEPYATNRELGAFILIDRQTN